jgi:hypothetical protein
VNEIEQSQGSNVVLRIVSGFGGVVILLISALVTFGASLAAPVGVFVALRRARRRERPFTRLVSWLSAVLASIIMLVLGLLVLAAVLPESAWQEMQKGAPEAQVARDTVRSPAWMTKLFPRTAQADSVANKLANSSGAFVVGMVLGVVFVCVVFGAIGGSAGWLASVLLRYAFWGVPT